MSMLEVEFDSVRFMSLIWSHLDFLHSEIRAYIVISISAIDAYAFTVVPYIIYHIFVKCVNISVIFTSASV